MKRFLILAIISVALVSCGTNQSPEQNDPNNAVDKVKQNNTETAGMVKDSSVKDEAKPIMLSEDDFAKKVFNYRAKGAWKYLGDKPCMVDFYAPWCGPCKIIAPYMEEFAKTYNGKMYMYKVNTDNARELSAYFDINSIPAVMFCPMKGSYKMIVGANRKDQYISLIETFLMVK
jgi:thioredoxin